MSASLPVPDPFDFTGRTAIVTGGTKGLGRVIAATFLGRGADVFVCARHAAVRGAAADPHGWRHRRVRAQAARRPIQ